MEKPFKAWKSAEIPKIALGSLEMQRKAKYTDVLIKNGYQLNQRLMNINPGLSLAENPLNAKKTSGFS